MLTWTWPWEPADHPVVELELHAESTERSVRRVGKYSYLVMRSQLPTTQADKLGWGTVRMVARPIVHE